MEVPLSSGLIKQIDLGGYSLYALKDRIIGWTLISIQPITYIPRKENEFEALLNEVKLINLFFTDEYKNLSIIFLFIKNRMNFRLLLVFSLPIIRLNKKTIRKFVSTIEGLMEIFEIFNFKKDYNFEVDANKLIKILFNKYHISYIFCRFIIDEETENLFQIQNNTDSVKPFIPVSRGFQFDIDDEINLFLILLRYKNLQKKIINNSDDKTYRSVYFLLGTLTKREIYEKTDKILAKLSQLLFARVNDRMDLKYRRKRTKTTIYDIIKKRQLLIPNSIVSNDSLDNLIKQILILSSIWGEKSTGITIGDNVLRERANGDIYIGKQILNGVPVAPFYISVEDLERHTLIVGPSGKGKTRLSIKIVTEILEKALGNVWIFDFHGEYLFLRDLGFILVSFGDTSTPVSINIFENPFENPQDYSYFISRLFLETIKEPHYDFTPQMEYALNNAIFKTVSERDPNKKNPIGFVLNLWDWTQKFVKLNLNTPQNTFFAVLNRIRPIFTGVLSPIFWSIKTNLSFSNLLNKNVIFNLSPLIKKGASKRDLIFLVNMLLKFIFNILIRSDKPLKKRIFLIIEEARYIVPWRQRSSTADTSTIEDFAILARKYGLSLITITQSFSSISRDILENIGTFFMLGADPKATEMPILDQEIVSQASKLPPKQAVAVITSIPGFAHIIIDDVKIPKTIKRDDIKPDIKLVETYSPILIHLDKIIDFIKNNDTDISELSYRVLQIVKESYEPIICDKETFSKYKLLLTSINTFLNSIDFDTQHMEKLENKRKGLYILQKIRDNSKALVELINNNLTILIDGKEKIFSAVKCILLESVYRLLKINNENAEDYNWDIEDITNNILEQLSIYRSNIMKTDNP